MKEETFVVNGMTCASCVINVEKAVNHRSHRAERHTRGRGRGCCAGRC